MGHRCHFIYPSCREYAITLVRNERSAYLQFYLDTPWDEPTANSPEFVGYVNGEIFTEHPWNLIPIEPLCAQCSPHHKLFSIDEENHSFN